MRSGEGPGSRMPPARRAGKGKSHGRGLPGSFLGQQKPFQSCVREDVHLTVQGYLTSHPLIFYTEALCNSSFLASVRLFELVKGEVFKYGLSALTAEIGLFKAFDRHIPPKSKAETSALQEELCIRPRKWLHAGLSL